jgi:hypothetical protein
MPLNRHADFRVTKKRGETNELGIVESGLLEGLATKGSVSMDQDKIEDEPRFDGKWVLQDSGIKLLLFF